jgi:hypothetical protein
MALWYGQVAIAWHPKRLDTTLTIRKSRSRLMNWLGG